MTHYPFAGTRLNKILFGLFLTAMLYLSRDTLLTTSILGFAKSQFLMLGLMALAGVIFLVYNRRDLKKILTDPRMAMLVISAAGILLPMLGKQDWQMMYFSVLLCLFFAVFVSYFSTAEEVAKYFVLIVTAVGLYSIVATYFLRLLPDKGILNTPVFYNPIGVDFYNFGFSFVSLDYCANRNFGIFREPGVHQYFIMLALILNNYTVRWEKESSMWGLNFLLAAVMLSTLAAGGYVEMFLLAFIVFFDKKLYRNKYACGLVIAMIAIAAAVVLYARAQQNQLWWEIYAMTVSKVVEWDESGADRIGSLFVNLGFFLKNPVFGGKVAEVLHSMENNTSSTTLMFGIFGLLGGLLHVAGWFALLVRKGRKLWVSLGLLLVAFMSFNTQNLIADVFLWLLPTMALTEWVLAHTKESI